MAADECASLTGTHGGCASRSASLSMVARFSSMRTAPSAVPMSRLVYCGLNARLVTAVSASTSTSHR